MVLKEQREISAMKTNFVYYTTWPTSRTNKKSHSIRLLKPQQTLKVLKNGPKNPTFEN